MSKPSYGGPCLCAMLVLAMVMGVQQAVQAAPATAPAPAVDCSTVIFTMTDCLTFVTGTDKKPSSACCTELSTVVKTSPQCLCQLYNTSLTSSVGINVTIAQQLPVKCKVQTPDPSLCSGFGIPVPGPAATTPSSMSPATSPTSTTAPAPAAPGPAATSSPSGMSGSPAGSTTPAVPSTSTATNTTMAPKPNSAPGALLRGAVPAIAMIVTYLALA